MKKVVLVIVCFFVLIFNVNAVEFSAGIGTDVGFFSSSTKLGISALFDFKYVEAYVGLRYSFFQYSETATLFYFGVNGKYPFKITETVNIFPLLGMDFSNHISINAGVGGDFYIDQNLYIRGELNLAFVQDSIGTKTVKTGQKNIFGMDKTRTVPAFSTREIGPVLKLAIGYRFSNDTPNSR